MLNTFFNASQSYKSTLFPDVDVNYANAFVVVVNVDKLFATLEMHICPNF